MFENEKTKRVKETTKPLDEELSEKTEIKITKIKVEKK